MASVAPCGSSDEPPAKRRKVHGSQAAELKKCPKFWFKSGDFVVIAKRKLAFRVHGDILGRKSKVFNDLLNPDLPRPELEETMEGCPIVHITDSRNDFFIFLKLIYDGFEGHQRITQCPRWATTRAMILLGDKYDVPELHKEGIKQLCAWYSDDIPHWDHRDTKFFAHEAEHLSVAKITHKLHKDDLHAAVLYHCCRLPASQLVSGDPETGCPPLCAKDLSCTLTFIKEMPRHWLSLASELDDDALCDELEACTECFGDRHAVQTAIGDYMKTEFGFESPCYKFLDHAAWSQLRHTVEEILCEECLSYFRTRLREARQGYRSRLVDLQANPSEASPTSDLPTL